MYGTCETLCRELAAQYTENTPLMLVVWSPSCGAGAHAPCGR